MTYLGNLNGTKRVDFHENSANGTVASNSTSRSDGLALIQSNYEDERPSLPIDGVRSQLVGILRKNDTIIIIGETGSGKSTQVPQMCIEAGLHKEGKIGVTQPRRVAAMALASRVSEEMGTELSEEVGYKFRFENQTCDKTNIVFLTDGILLQELVHDSLLNDYSTIIIDEAHERSLHTDILFYLLRLVQKQRREKTDCMPLKLVIMSATMQSGKMSEYFNNSPVYYIEGRTYPVELFHANQLSIKDDDFVFNAVTTVLDLHQTEPIDHDFLVFLTGQDDIENARKMILDDQKKSNKNDMLPIALYAALTPAMQSRAFGKAPPNTRKVIFSTNIAETSLTIPGIRVVIETGKVKQKFFTAQNRIEILRCISISKAQAIQRAGRAGREAPGKCYRLYSEKDYEKFEEMPKPEILRSNLCGVLLNLFMIGLKSIKALKLLDLPDKEIIDFSMNELQKMDAIEIVEKEMKKSKEKIIKAKVTPLGKKLAQFPIDPAYARIVAAAEQLNCLEEALTIVAFISSEDVFVPIQSSSKEFENATRKFDTNEGDHIKLLNVYRAYKTAKKSKKGAELRDWCLLNGLQDRRLNNVVKARAKLRETCANLKMNIGSCGQNNSLLRQAIAHGLFMNACEYDRASESFKLISSPAVRIKIHPSSCLARTRPTTIVFTELIKTTELYARTVSLVDPEWIKDALCDKNRIL